MEENKDLVFTDEEYAKLPALTDADARVIADAVAEVLDSKRASDIKVIYVHDKTSIADYFVLATGNSSTHVQSLAGELEHKMDLRKLPVNGTDGRDNNSWIVLDYSCVLVHIFTRDTRDFYNIEKLYD